MWEKPSSGGGSIGPQGPKGDTGPQGPVGPQGPAGSGGSGASTATYPNMIIYGTCKFIINMYTRTITWTAGELNSTYASYSLVAGSTGSLSTDVWNTGNVLHYLICYNPSTGIIEVKKDSDMLTYDGLILFASKYAAVSILSYPKNLVNIEINSDTVTGNDTAKIIGQYEIDIRDMVIIGDSLSALDRWAATLDQLLYIPKRTNLAASGTKMSTYMTGMYGNASITATTQLVYIMAGTNDCGFQVTVGTLKQGAPYDVNTFFGAYQNLIEGLYGKNPNMRIMLGVPPKAWFPAGTDTGTPTYSVTNSELAPYQQAVRDIAKYYAIPCFDTPNVMGINDFNYNSWYVDKMHFNPFGYEKLGRRIAEFIIANY